MADLKEPYYFGMSCGGYGLIQTDEDLDRVIDYLKHSIDKLTEKQAYLEELRYEIQLEKMQQQTFQE
jgi:hypothetical protein